MSSLTLEYNDLLNKFSGIIFNEGYLGNIGSASYSVTQMNNSVDGHVTISMIATHSQIKNKLVSFNVDNVFDIYSSDVRLEGLDEAVSKDIAQKLDNFNASRKSLATKFADALGIGKVKGAEGDTRVITVAEAVKVEMEHVRREINQVFKDYKMDTNNPLKPNGEKVDSLIKKFQETNKKLLDALEVSLDSPKVKADSEEYRHQLETYNQLYQWNNQVNKVLNNIATELGNTNGEISSMRVFELGADLAEILYGQQSTVESYGKKEGIIDENGNIRVLQYDRSAKLREFEAPKRTKFHAISVGALIGSWVQIGFLLFGAKMHDYSVLSGISYATLLACVFEYAKHSTNYLLRSSSAEFVSPDVTVFMKNLNIPDELKPYIAVPFARMAKIRYSNSTIFGNNGINQSLKVWLFNSNYREIINNDTQGDIYSLMVGQTHNHNKKAAKISYILKHHLTDEKGELKYGLTEENAKRLAFSLAVEDRNFTAYGTVMEVISRAGLHTSQGIRFSRRAGKKGFENVCMNAFKKLLLDKDLMTTEQIKKLDKQLIKNFNQFDILGMLNKESREKTLRWLLTKYAREDSKLELTTDKITKIINATNDSAEQKGLKQYVAETMHELTQNLDSKYSKPFGVQVDPIDQSKAMWLVETIIKEVEYENTVQAMGSLGNKLSVGLSLNPEEQNEIKGMFSVFGVNEQNQAVLLTKLSSDKKIEDFALHIAGVDALPEDIDAAIDMVEGAELISFFERKNHKFHQEGNLKEVARLLLEKNKNEEDISTTALYKAIQKHFNVQEEKKVIEILIKISDGRDVRDKAITKDRWGSSSSFREDIRLRISENVFGADNSGKYSLRKISDVSEVLGDVIAREVAKVQLEWFNSRREKVSASIGSGLSTEQALKKFNIELQEAIEDKIKKILANPDVFVTQKNMGLMSKQHFNNVINKALRENRLENSKFKRKILPIGRAEARIEGFKLFGLEKFNVTAKDLVDELITSGYIKSVDVAGLSEENKKNLADIVKDNNFLKIKDDKLYIVPGIDSGTIGKLAGIGIAKEDIKTIIDGYKKGSKDVYPLISNIITSLAKLNNKEYLKSQFVPYERFMEQQLYEVYINAKLLSEITEGSDFTKETTKWLSILKGFVTSIEAESEAERKEAFETLHELDATIGKPYSEWMKDAVIESSMDTISSFLDETENVRRGHYNIARRRMNEAMKLFDRLKKEPESYDVKDAIEKTENLNAIEEKLKGYEKKFGSEVFKAINAIITDAVGGDVDGEFLTYEEIAPRIFALLVGTSGELTFDSKNQLKSASFYKERKYQIKEAGEYAEGIYEFHLLNMVNMLAKSFINADGEIDVAKRDATIDSMLNEAELDMSTINKKALEAELKELEKKDADRGKQGKNPINNDKIFAIKVALSSLNNENSFFANLSEVYDNVETIIREYVEKKKEQSELEEHLFNLVPAIVFGEDETKEAAEMTFNFRFRLIDGLKKLVNSENFDDDKTLSIDAVSAYFKQQTPLYGGIGGSNEKVVFDALADSIAKILKADNSPALTDKDKDKEKVKDIKNDFEPVFMFDRAGAPIGWRKSKAGNTNNVLLGQTHAQRLANKIHLLLDVKGMEDYAFSRRFNPALLNELEIGLVKKIRLSDDATVDRELKYKKGMMPDQITAFIVKNIPRNGELDVETIRKNLIESWGLGAGQLNSVRRFNSLNGKLEKYIREIAVAYYGAIAVQKYSFDKFKVELDKFTNDKQSDLVAIISPELFSVLRDKEKARELLGYLKGDNEVISADISAALSEKEKSLITELKDTNIQVIIDKLSKKEKTVASLFSNLQKVAEKLYSNDNLMGEWWTWSAQFQNWSDRGQTGSTIAGIGKAVAKDAKRSIGKYIPLQELITPESRSYVETVMNMASIGTYPEYIKDHGRRLPFKQELIKMAKWMDFMEQVGIPLTEQNMFKLFESIRTKEPTTIKEEINEKFGKVLDDEETKRLELMLKEAKLIDNFADKRKYLPSATQKIKAEFIGNFDSDNYAFINYVQTIGTLGVKWQFRNIKTTINILENLKEKMSKEHQSKVDVLINKIKENASNLKYDKQEMEDILIGFKGLVELVDETGKEVIRNELLKEQLIMNPLRWWSAIMQFGQNFENIENDLIRAQQMTDETNSKGMKQKTIAGCYNYSHINSISQVSRFENLAIEVEDKDHYIRDYVFPLINKIFYKEQFTWDKFWGQTMYGQFKPNDYLYDEKGKRLYSWVGTLMRQGILMPHILATRFRTQSGSSNFYQGFRGLQVVTTLAVLSSLATATGVGIPVGIAIGILTAIAFKQIGSVASGLILKLAKSVGQNPELASFAIIAGLALAGGAVLLTPAIILPLVDYGLWSGINALPLGSISNIASYIPAFITANHYLVASLATAVGLLSPGQGVLAKGVAKLKGAHEYGKITDKGFVTTEAIQKNIFKNQKDIDEEQSIILAKQLVKKIKEEELDYANRDNQVSIDIDTDSNKDNLLNILKELGLSELAIKALISKFQESYNKSELANTRRVWGQMVNKEKFLTEELDKVKANNFVNKELNAVRLQGNKFFAEEEIYNEASIVEDFSTSYYAYSKGYTIDYAEDTVGVNGANSWLYPLGTQRTRWWGGMGEQEPFMKDMFKHNLDKLSTYNWYKLWCGAAGPLSAGLDRALFVNSTIFVASILASIVLPAAAAYVITPLVFSSAAFGGAHILVGLTVAHLSYVLTLGTIRLSKMVKGATWEESSELFSLVKGPGSSIMYPESIVRKFNQRTGFVQTVDAPVPLMSEPNHWVINYSRMMANVEVLKAYILFLAGILGSLVSPALALLAPVGIWSMINKVNISRGLALNHAFAREYDVDYNITSEKQRDDMQKRWDRNYKDQISRNNSIIDKDGLPSVFGANIGLARSIQRMFRFELY